MTQLCRAIYVSQAVGNAGSNLLSVAEILGVSERNNRRDRLTGVLLSHDGWFLQALEGARIDIDRLLTRLHKDPRHTDIRMLGFETIRERTFPEWSMGQILVTPRLAPLVLRQPMDALTAGSAFALLVAAVAQAGAQA
ncbi:BLUF domain-containing protein [Brevundimonas sp.]|uniref:BLUF domain-containing protein n=1 Tax=Brevundimonas sp. TaxID=1871086 RepID=UPI001D87FD47|nr:BLUF domain-containing protein [Brevundimonas sp.]MBA4000461.1 blue light sensor protein [Brevundimonas sp.]